MDIKEIEELIKNGEKIDVEFKESQNRLTKDIFDTVCSFNNRNGGTILLGISDKGEILGVNEDKIDKIIKEFVTSVNNPQKIYPPLYLNPKIIEIENKKIIYINIPVGYQVCRHSGKIFDRLHEGDIDITNNSESVHKMYSKKQTSYFVNKVYPNLSYEYLDTNLINRVRKMASIRKKDHLWESLDNIELLRSLNLILIDPDTGKEGMTLAAILLFGKDNLIMSVLPQHKTDAIFRIENEDRYDDREVISTNLIESYEKLLSFGQKHLNDLFVLEGIVNVSARDRILREIIANTLAHRDYSSGFPSKMIIEKDRIMIENSNLANGNGILDLQNFKPFPKNPQISKLFREIGLAEELGSGMRNVNRYTKLYSGGIPIFEEGDVFRTIIPLKRTSTEKIGAENIFEKVPRKVSRKVPRKVPRKSTEEMERDILSMVENNNKITRKSMAKSLGVTEKTVTRIIKQISELNYIGKGKNGYWELKK